MYYCIVIPQVSPELKTERDVIMYRAYIAQRKFGVVLDEVTPAAPPELLAVRMFADFLSNESRRFVKVKITLLCLIHFYIYISLKYNKV